MTKKNEVYNNTEITKKPSRWLTSVYYSPSPSLELRIICLHSNRTQLPHLKSRQRSRSKKARTRIIVKFIIFKNPTKASTDLPEIQYYPIC